MTPELIEAYKISAAHRGKDYVVQYWAAKEPDLSFLEQYEDFEEMQRGKKWWSTMNYVVRRVWIL